MHKHKQTHTLVTFHINAKVYLEMMFTFHWHLKILNIKLVRMSLLLKIQVDVKKSETC